MLDPQVDGVATMVDKTAERIATLGSSPNGLPGNVVANRSWDDYSLSQAHLESASGKLSTAGASSEVAAARSATRGANGSKK